MSRHYTSGWDHDGAGDIMHESVTKAAEVALRDELLIPRLQQRVKAFGPDNCTALSISARVDPILDAMGEQTNNNGRVHETCAKLASTTGMRHDPISLADFHLDEDKSLPEIDTREGPELNHAAVAKLIASDKIRNFRPGHSWKYTATGKPIDPTKPFDKQGAVRQPPHPGLKAGQVHILIDYQRRQLATDTILYFEAFDDLDAVHRSLEDHFSIAGHLPPNTILILQPFNRTMLGFNIEQARRRGCRLYSDEIFQPRILFNGDSSLLDDLAITMPDVYASIAEKASPTRLLATSHATLMSHRAAGGGSARDDHDTGTASPLST